MKSGKYNTKNGKTKRALRVVRVKGSLGDPLIGIDLSTWDAFLGHTQERKTREAAQRAANRAAKLPREKS